MRCKILCILLVLAALNSAYAIPPEPNMWPTYRHDKTLTGMSPLKGGMEVKPVLLWSTNLGSSTLTSEDWLIDDFDGDHNYELLRALPDEDRLICQDMYGVQMWDINNVPDITVTEIRDFAGDGGRGILFKSFTGTQTNWYIVDGNSGGYALLYSTHDIFGDEQRIGYILPGVAGQQICAWWDGDDNPSLNHWAHGYIFSFENGVSNPTSRFFAEEKASIWGAQHLLADMDDDGDTEMVLISYEKAWVYDRDTSVKEYTLNWNLGIRDYRAHMAAMPLRPGQKPSFLVINPFIPGLMVVTQNGSTANMIWKNVIGPEESQYQLSVKIGVGAPDPFIDLDKDGQIEMIMAITNEYGGNNTYLNIFGADTGDKLFENINMRVISAEDLDNDGNLEVFLKEGTITQAPGAWAGGPGNFIPVVGAGDTLHIASFGPTGPAGAYEFTDIWTYSGDANPVFKPQPPEEDLTRSMGFTTTYKNPEIWRETPDSNSFLMKFGSIVWSCYLSGGTLVQDSIITVHEALGNDPLPPEPNETYAWQGSDLVSYVDSVEVYRITLPRYNSYLAPPPIVGELGGEVRVIVRKKDGSIISLAIDGTDSRTLLNNSPAYSGSGHVKHSPMMLCDVDGDGKNELLASTLDAVPKVVAVDENGTVELTINALPNYTDMILVGAGRLSASASDGHWVAIRCYRVNDTTAVAAYNGKTGAQMWVRDTFGGTTSFTATIPTSVYDYNGDNADDLVVVSGNYYGIIDVKNNTNLVVTGSSPPFSLGVPDHWTAYGSPMVVDILNTGTPQVIIASGWAMFWNVDLLGNPVWHYRMSVDTDSHSIFNDGIRVGMTDFDGDNKIDAVMAQDDGLLRAFDAEGLNQKCPKCAPGQPLVASNHSADLIWEYQLEPPIGGFASADLDGDGKGELLCGSRGGLFALKQVGGVCSVLWSKDFGQAVGSPIIADLNDDGIGEILVTTEDGYLRCLSSGYNVDFNNDGKVNIVDFAYIARDWMWFGQ